MITDLIINVLLSPILLLVKLLPDLSVSISTDVFDGLDTIFQYLAYFLPVGALLPLMLLSIAFSGFQIIMAIVVRIKSFIPTMGA